MTNVQASSRVARTFLRFIDQMNRILGRLASLALAVMVVSVFIGVLARFVFTHAGIRVSVPWTEEVSRYLMIWTVFIGAGIACRHGRLIGVEYVVGILSPPLGRALKYLSLLLAFAFYVLLCVVGWQWMEFGGSQDSPVMEIPMIYVNVAMMVGGVLMALNTVALVVESRLAARDIRHPIDAPVSDGSEKPLDATRLAAPEVSHSANQQTARRIA